MANLVRSARPMVNSKLFSDVSFTVGRQGTVFYGHRSQLALASDVFFRMFSSELTPSNCDHRINVPDIEPDVFLEMLNFIYYDKSTITEDNCVLLYYAAEKYNLDKLIQGCLEFVNREEDSVLKIFSANMEFGFDGLTEACLNIICENPFKIFRRADFLELPLELVLTIAGQSKLRCNYDQTKEAVLRWIERHKNDATAEVLRQKALNGLKKIDDENQELITYNRCSKFMFFGSFGWGIEKTTMKITALAPIDLYGIGLHIGRYDKTQSGEAQITVSVVSAEDKSLVQICAAQVPIKEGIYVYDCMFERISLRTKSEVVLEWDTIYRDDKSTSVQGSLRHLNWKNNSVMQVCFEKEQPNSNDVSNIAYILYKMK